jgi:hypothetical protein
MSQGARDNLLVPKIEKVAPPQEPDSFTCWISV